MQTILVCDDDKQIVEAISIYLTGEGFHVLKAYDGYDVLDIMEKNKADRRCDDAGARWCTHCTEGT